jgi:hypothetical protein
MQTDIHVDKTTFDDYTHPTVSRRPFVTVNARDGGRGVVKLFFADLDVLDAHIAACREARNLLAAAVTETQEVA